MKHLLLGNRKKGVLFIISAPAGTGKTTLVNHLTKDFPCVVRNVSYTTRAPRATEKDGVDYHFIDDETFAVKVKNRDFLEHATLYGNRYGTCRRWVEDQLDKGHHVVLVIDTQGALQVKKQIPVVTVFIKPPSIAELRRRLSSRKTESEKSIKERLDWAHHEIDLSTDYDYVFVNDNLKMAYQILRSIFIAEEHRGIQKRSNAK